MQIISFEFINKITSDGIYYKNSKKMENFIDFSECYNNWINYQNKHNMKLTETVYKYIGQRDSCANPMFIELFSKPFVRFEFVQNAKKEFDFLRDKIKTMGWETLDLS